MRRRHALIPLFFPFLLAPGCNLPNHNKEPAPENVRRPAWETGTDEELPLGDTFEHDDFKLRVFAPRICSPSSALTPPQGMIRFSLPIELQVLSKRGMTLNPLHFTIEDKEGHRFRATLAGCVPTIATQQLSQGSSIRGEVAFDLPHSLKKFELIFEPFLVGRKPVIARLLVPPRADTPPAQ